MNALERIAAVLEEARIAGGWSDEAVAADVLQALGLDDDGKNAVEQAVVSAACRWHAADIYVQPNLSREDAVRNGAAELINAVERYKSAQPAASDPDARQVFSDQAPTSSNLGHG